MARRRSSLSRLDAAVVPALRRALAASGRPLQRLAAWERQPDRPPLVRDVVEHPLLVAALAGVVVFAGSAVHLSRTTEAGAPPTPSAAEGVDPTSETPPAEVGPLVGADVASYREGRHAVLATLDLDEPVRAVVSFTDYRDAEGIPDLGAVDVEAVLLRIPAEEERPRTVPVGDDPAGAVEVAEREERDRLDEEIEQLESMLEEDLGDPAFREDFELRLDELRGARNVLAAGAATVFAAVVVADVETLRALVDREGVRVVDAGGPARTTGTTTFHGILPDDRERATTGRTL